MIEKIKELGMREKVVIVVLLVVVVYGLYVFFSGHFATRPGSGGTTLTDRGVPNIEKITSQVTQVLAEDQDAMIDAYIVARAETEWETDPFYLGKSPLAGITLTYSGFIEYRGKALAIINNVEYEIGDELVSGGYFVRKITPGEVLIEDMGKLETITVPFAEE
ncbi:MAG: hypothetical protein JXO48_06135 [Deltaproteobacteria bacterium]|nr:hypothetical protein [Deltaproteobacteria bacterium]